MTPSTLLYRPLTSPPEHDAVAGLLVAADDGPAPELGARLALDLGVAAVYVAVQYGALRHGPVLLRKTN